MKKLSKTIESFVTTFLNLPVVKKQVNLTLIKELLKKDTDIRNNRFDNLCVLSVHCYDFRKFWNLPETKELRKSKKCDVMMEDAVRYIFGYNKAYFYRLAQMGEYVVTKPAKVTQYKKLNFVASGEYEVNALTFITYCKEGKLTPKKDSNNTKQNAEPTDVDNTENTADVVSNVTEPQDEIVFHLLCEGKEFIVMRTKDGGHITKVAGMQRQEIKAFITKYTTKATQDVLRGYSKHLAFGVTYVNNVIDMPSGLTQKQKEITQHSVSCYKW